MSFIKNLIFGSSELKRKELKVKVRLIKNYDKKTVHMVKVEFPNKESDPIEVLLPEWFDPFTLGEIDRVMPTFLEECLKRVYRIGQQHLMEDIEKTFNERKIK